MANVAKEITRKQMQARKRLGKSLMKLREDKGMTRNKLGTRTGMTITQIKRYELGLYSVGVDKLILALNVLADGKWSALDN